MNFEWIDCHFFLKKSVGNAQVTLNLKPLYRLRYVDSELENRDIIYDLAISFEKPLMFDRNIGWNWHKSWNIPDITVELKANMEEGLQIAKSLKGLKAEIYIVKPVFSKEYSMYIQDLQLEGSTCYCLRNNHARFESLRFSATSYNTEGSKFHFLVVIYQQSPELDQDWRVLVSKISTPLFVDSRKSAREVEVIKLKKLSSFIEPFELSCLDKIYVKKECKRVKDVIFQEEIHNDIFGLVNYFGAANIRNKIKHPLFLSFKFSSCFQVYLNGKFLKAMDPKAEITFLQNSLQQSYRQRDYSQNFTRTQNKKLILLIRGKYEDNKQSLVKKAIEFLQSLESEFIEVMGQETRVPGNFKKMETNQEILKQYQKIKNSLFENHTIQYKTKQNSFKKQFSQRSISEEVTQIDEVKIEQRQELVNSSEQSNNKFKEIDEESSSSESVEEFVVDSFKQNQLLNIPLKCEISINPIKNRPLTMNQVVKLHTAYHTTHNLVKCDQSKNISEKQLKLLNQLMKSEIVELRKKIYDKNRQERLLAMNKCALKEEIKQQQQNIMVSARNQNPVKQEQIEGSIEMSSYS